MIQEIQEILEGHDRRVATIPLTEPRRQRLAAFEPLAIAKADATAYPDPTTGKPFAYKDEGESFTLTAAAISGDTKPPLQVTVPRPTVGAWLRSRLGL